MKIQKKGIMKSPRVLRKERTVSRVHVEGLTLEVVSFPPLEEDKARLGAKKDTHWGGAGEGTCEERHFRGFLCDALTRQDHLVGE